MAILAAAGAPADGNARVWYITVDGTGDLPTIQAAIDSAADGDTVLVAAGRYTWTNQGSGTEYGLIRFLRGQTGFKFLSESGAEATILDAEGQGRVCFIQGYNEITLDGFTFANGVAPEFGYYAGGGIVGHLSSPIIKNCIFRDNSAEQGGGIWYGGQNATRVTNCQFYNNTANYGGAVFWINSELVASFRNCKFYNNHATISGGAIFLYHVEITFLNCTIYNNTAVENGGGLYCEKIHPVTFTQCTFSENISPNGTAIYLSRLNDTLTVEQSIVAFGQGGPAMSISEGTIDISCSNVYGNEGGNDYPAGTIDSGGNFSADPKYCALLGEYIYTLQETSPCAPGNHPDGFDCGRIGSRNVNCGGIPVERKTLGGLKNLFSE
jgi:predicted outer membrane repeat protein